MEMKRCIVGISAIFSFLKQSFIFHKLSMAEETKKDPFSSSMCSDVAIAEGLKLKFETWLVEMRRGFSKL